MPVMLVAVHAPSIPADELVPWSWWPLAMVMLAAGFAAVLAAIGAWLVHRRLVMETPIAIAEHVVSPQPAAAANAYEEPVVSAARGVASGRAA